MGRALSWMAISLVVLFVGSCDDGEDGDEEDSGLDSGEDGGAEAGPDDAGHPAAPSKGPWTLQPATDAITVRWESRTAPETVAVQYRPVEGGEMRTAEGESRETEVMTEHGVDGRIVEEPDFAGTFSLQEVRIDGLAPATCYRYTIVGFAAHGGRFCTMHAADDHETPIRFYVVGDTNPAIIDSARFFEATDPEQAEFVVHTGDVQYYSSLVESWAVWFGLAEPMLEAGAFLPCVGNHEREKPTEFEDFYGRLFERPGADGGNTIRYHYATGGVHFFSLSTERDITEGSAQLEWLEAKLDEVESRPTYRFSVLYMHRPLYSVGEGGPNDSDRPALEPVIDAHAVPLVLAGHVHGYERFEVGDVTYITAGGGGGLLANIDEHVGDFPEMADKRVASGAFHHALHIEITSSTLSGRVIDTEGEVRDSFDKPIGGM